MSFILLTQFEGRVTLRKQVRDKYLDRLQAAGKVREGFFQRQYGENWREHILRVNQAFVAELLKGITVNIAFCMNLREELARQLEGGWDYLSPRMEEGYRRGVAVSRLCERM